MRNPLFVRLLNLYLSHRQKVPREDFFTEVLAGVLQSDQQLLNDYAHEILCLPKGEYNLTTQKNYPGSKIDMVFESGNCLCFVENKVDAPEGQKQLSKYAKILLDYTSVKEVCSLRYCTWYQDQKAPEDYHPALPESFRQFRWPEVYNFLEGYRSSNPLVAAFLVLLEEYRMNKLPDFTGEDLITMRQIGSTILKMDECFEIIKPRFTYLFGVPYQRDYERLKQIPQFGRYALWREDIIRGQGYSDLLLAFGFEMEDPLLYVQCCCKLQHQAYSNFKQAIVNSNLPGLEIEENSWGYIAWFEKPLSDFILSNNQFKDITDWFINKLELWAEFMRQDKTVKWNLIKRVQPSGNF